MPYFKLTLEGNIGRDAEVQTVNGQNVIKFSVAVNQDYKDAQGVKHSKTTWVSCNRWQPLSASTTIVAYLKRGSKVIVEGIPEINLYKDNQGVSRADMRCKVKEIHLLSSTANNNNDNNNSQSNSQPVGNVSSDIPADATEPLDDLPF